MWTASILLYMILAPGANFHVICHGPELKSDVFFDLASFIMPGFRAFVAVFMPACVATELIVVRRSHVVASAVRLWAPFYIKVFFNSLNLFKMLVFLSNFFGHEYVNIAFKELTVAAWTAQMPDICFHDFDFDIGF